MEEDGVNLALGCLELIQSGGLSLRKIIQNWAWVEENRNKLSEIGDWGFFWGDTKVIVLAMLPGHVCLLPQGEHSSSFPSELTGLRERQAWALSLLILLVTPDLLTVNSELAGVGRASGSCPMHCSLSALPEVYLGHCVYYHSTSQYMNHELSDVQAGFGKGRRTRAQIASICWIIEKAKEFQKNSYFCFTDYTKAFVWITTSCGKFLKRWEYQTTWPVAWEISMQV